MPTAPPSPSTRLRRAIAHRSAAWAGLSAYFTDDELEAFARGDVVPTVEQDKLIIVVSGGSLGGWSNEGAGE